MLMSLSNSYSLCLAVIGEQLSIQLTCLSEGEQRYTRPRSSFTNEKNTNKWIIIITRTNERINQIKRMNEWLKCLGSREGGTDSTSWLVCTAHAFLICLFLSVFYIFLLLCLSASLCPLYQQIPISVISALTQDSIPSMNYLLVLFLCSDWSFNNFLQSMFGLLLDEHENRTERHDSGS